MVSGVYRDKESFSEWWTIRKIILYIFECGYITFPKIKKYWSFLQCNTKMVSQTCYFISINKFFLLKHRSGAKNGIHYFLKDKCVIKMWNNKTILLTYFYFRNATKKCSFFSPRLFFTLYDIDLHGLIYPFLYDLFICCILNSLKGFSNYSLLTFRTWYWALSVQLS